MCIIVFKPMGQKMIEESVVKTCMKNNKDGAGYMFNTPAGVLCRKGFSKADVLCKALQDDLKFNEVREEDVDIALHCRIGTAGLIKPENCHPFPITKNIGMLQSLFSITPSAMMHNGMIDIKDDKYPNLSDTQIFVRNILSSVPLENDGTKKLIEMATAGSRLIVFDKHGLVFSTGKWEQDKEIYYSNTTYKEHSWGYIGKYGWDFESWETSTYGHNDIGIEKCYFCDVNIHKHNKALLTDKERDEMGVPKGNNICDWCGDWWRRETKRLGGK